VGLSGYFLKFLLLACGTGTGVLVDEFTSGAGSVVVVEIAAVLANYLMHLLSQ
jgi:16S rRNA A1518/A1519 N6-dimethyltransferase RsmA/KsgA/DIM1 with predicted DNA glycosylase/AP lyase activity